MLKAGCECKECIEEEQPRCACGVLLEGQYNNGEEHDECAVCREGRLCDEAYEWERDYELSEEAYHDD